MFLGLPMRRDMLRRFFNWLRRLWRQRQRDVDTRWLLPSLCERCETMEQFDHVLRVHQAMDRAWQCPEASRDAARWRAHFSASLRNGDL